MALMSSWAGHDYAGMLAMIVRAAAARYGIAAGDAVRPAA